MEEVKVVFEIEMKANANGLKIAPNHDHATISMFKNDRRNSGGTLLQKEKKEKEKKEKK